MEIAPLPRPLYACGKSEVLTPGFDQVQPSYCSYMESKPVCKNVSTFVSAFQTNKQSLKNININQRLTELLVLESAEHGIAISQAQLKIPRQMAAVRMGKGKITPWKRKRKRWIHQIYPCKGSMLPENFLSLLWQLSQCCHSLLTTHTPRTSGEHSKTLPVLVKHREMQRSQHVSRSRGEKFHRCDRKLVVVVDWTAGNSEEREPDKLKRQVQKPLRGGSPLENMGPMSVLKFIRYVVGKI